MTDAIRKEFTRKVWAIQRATLPSMRNSELTAEQMRRYLIRNTITQPNGCETYTGAPMTCGYSRIRWKGAFYLGHRLSYSLFVGPIPRDMCVCHTCDVRTCINPEHLWLGTIGDNTRDAAAKGRIHRASGALNGRARLTADKAQAIRNAYASGNISHAALAKEYACGERTVGNICNGVSWRDAIDDAMARGEG